MYHDESYVCVVFSCFNHTVKCLWAVLEVPEAEDTLRVHELMQF